MCSARGWSRTWPELDNPEADRYAKATAGRATTAGRTHLRARHLGSALRSAGDLPLRRARGRAAGRRHLGTRGASATIRRSATSRARRCATSTTCGSARTTRLSRSPSGERRFTARRTEPLQHVRAARPGCSSATTTRASSPSRSTWRTTGSMSRSSPRTCRCASRPHRSASPPRSTGPNWRWTPAGPGMAEIDLGSEQMAELYDNETLSTAAGGATCRSTPGSSSTPTAARRSVACTGRGDAAARARRPRHLRAARPVAPSSGSPSTCCSTPRSASSRSAGAPEPASRRSRCAPASRPCSRSSSTARSWCSARSTRSAGRSSASCRATPPRR